MRLFFNKLFTALFITVVFIIPLTSCVSNAPKPEPRPDPTQPIPKTIRIKATELTGGTPGSTIQKDLFNIVITPRQIIINEKPVKNTQALDKILKQYTRPVFTISAHKCAKSEFTAKVMALIQTHTDSPIAYGSYGQYDDAVCK